MLLFMYFRLLKAVVNQSLNLCYLVIYSFCFFLVCLRTSFQSLCKEFVLHFIFSKYRIKLVKDGRLHT